MQSTIAIIGSGNMGSCFIRGLIAEGFAPQNIWATDPSDEKLSELSNKFHINTTKENEIAIEHANVIIFAIKPQVFASVAKPLASVIQKKQPLVISIAAGIDIKSIEKWLGKNLAIIRAMPNTPALINEGATGLYANSFVSDEQKKLAEHIFDAIGLFIWTRHEDAIDTVTALSGSGPAYFFLMMEAMQNAGVELGLSMEDAELLAVQTALGAAILAKKSRESLQKLRQNVTSPGGTTEKAVSVLEENHFREIILKALKAAKARSKEISESYGET